MADLRFEDLVKHFGGVHALDGVSGHVDDGEILGLVGPNGSGKSTLINVLSGHYEADSGRVVLDGEDITDRPAHRIIEMGLALPIDPRPFDVTLGVSVPLMFGARKPRRPRRRLRVAGVRRGWRRMPMSPSPTSTSTSSSTWS